LPWRSAHWVLEELQRVVASLDQHLARLERELAAAVRNRERA
jgi:hypothetical protein